MQSLPGIRRNRVRLMLCSAPRRRDHSRHPRARYTLQTRQPGAPVLAAYLCKSWGTLPLDLGRQLRDGHPVFGSSKTWRGLISAIFTSCALSILFAYGIRFGLIFGSLVMAGDLLSSFTKRRRGFKPSDQSLGLDQLPESLIPSLYAVVALDVVWWWAIALPLSFMLIEIIVSRPMFRFNVRKHPY